MNELEKRVQNPFKNEGPPISALSEQEYLRQLESGEKFAELASFYREKGDYDTSISYLEKARKTYSLENLAETPPNSKDIVNSMAHDAWSATKATGRCAKATIKYTPKAILEGTKIIINSFFAPTVIRRIFEDDHDLKSGASFSLLGLTRLTSLGLLIECISGNSNNVRGGFIVPSIYIITDLASGAYEFYRHKKKKLAEQQQKAQEELSLLAPEKYQYKEEK